MRATQILMNEHRIIEQVLECLQIMADQASSGGGLNFRAARQVLDFFQHFADGCHHAKEERHLFPMMEAHGFAPSSGPTSVMRADHEEGRKHIRAMSTALEKAETGGKEGLDRFIYHARAYGRLMRDHIFREEQRLFPMADHVLTDEEQQRLSDAFGHVEATEMGTDVHEKYLEIADSLAQRFNLACAAHVIVANPGCYHGNHP